jgi:hypothetical protein
MMASKKYQFFISSTWEEFKNIRPKIIDQVLHIGHIPIGMEHFTAGQKLDKAFIASKIHASDVFVIIVGKTAGDWISSTEHYTHFEFATVGRRAGLETPSARRSRAHRSPNSSVSLFAKEQSQGFLRRVPVVARVDDPTR